MKIEKINDLIGHEGAIYALEESFEANKCYSGGFDNIIVEWDLELPKNPIGIAKLPSKAFSILKIENLGLLLVGQAQGGVHVIDIKTKKEVKFLKVHTDMVFDLHFDKTKNQLISVSADGSIAIWDCTKWDLIMHDTLSDQKLRCIEVLNDSIFVGCEDGTIKCLDSNYQTFKTITTHDAGFGVNVVKLSPDGEFLFSGSRDGHLNVHDIKNDFHLTKRIAAHNFAIYDIQFSPDKSMFVTASRDKSFKIWDLNKLTVLEKIDFKTGGHKASVNAVLWTDKNQIITTGDDRSIKVWKVNI